MTSFITNDFKQNTTFIFIVFDIKWIIFYDHKIWVSIKNYILFLCKRQYFFLPAAAAKTDNVSPMPASRKALNANSSSD